MSEALLRRKPQQTEPPRLREIADRLREASGVTPELLSDIIGTACQRLPLIRRTRDYDRLQQLIQSAAWTDATLALLELELPQWRLRYITYDAGEWHCALSRQRELPDWLDDSVEGHHTHLTLAILSAFVGVQRSDTPPAGIVAPEASCADEMLDVRLCCDNFA